MSIVKCLAGIQANMVILFEIPLWSICISFLFSTITVWTSFHVFVISDPVYDKLIRLKLINQEQEKKILHR